MKFTQNAKAISKLLLILLLLMATIIGAILSYLWVIGYFINLGSRIPGEPIVSIENVTFASQDTSYFNVTLLNPSYSPTEANVTEIAASTRDDIHNLTQVYPTLPYILLEGKEETFKCSWNWANYTGETVKIIAFIKDGSGPTSEIETPLVDLKITDVQFNSTISVTHFNLTVQNSVTSVTHVNITEVSVENETISAENISIPLPHPLHQNESVSFQCMYNWTKHQDKNVTVAVHTLQGYAAYHIHSTPNPVILTITNVLFNVPSTTGFNFTVQNSEDSPTYVNITRIAVTMENRTVREWTVENGTEVEPNLPHTLNSSSSQTFSCPWNWTDQRDKNVTVTTYTLQGFTAQYIQATPAPIILEIVNPIFNSLETSNFNVTIKNSECSTMDANVTEIVVNVDGISEAITDDVVPSLQGGITLSPGSNQTFTCSWNWAEYSGKNVTIVVQTQKGYSAYSSRVLLKTLTIADVLFNIVDTHHFIVSVQNPTELDFNITTMNAEIKDGPVLNITNLEPDLPFLLPSGRELVFMCSCDDWTDYQGMEVTITIETSEGYTTSYTYKIPSA